MMTSRAAPNIRRRPGRPRIDRAAPLCAISTRIPATAADRLIALAARRRTSVAATARDLLLVRLGDLPVSPK
jgi:hypothetical protein